MRPWARRTAVTTLVAVAVAAAGGGLSGTALAGTGGDGNSGVLSVLGGNGLFASAGNELSIPVDVCGDASALLGIAVAGCRGGAVASLERPRAVGGDTGRGSRGASRPEPGPPEPGPQARTPAVPGSVQPALCTRGPPRRSRVRPRSGRPSATPSTRLARARAIRIPPLLPRRSASAPCLAWPTCRP